MRLAIWSSSAFVAGVRAADLPMKAMVPKGPPGCVDGTAVGVVAASVAAGGGVAGTVTEGAAGADGPAGTFTRRLSIGPGGGAGRFALRSYVPGAPATGTRAGCTMTSCAKAGAAPRTSVASARLRTATEDDGITNCLSTKIRLKDSQWQGPAQPAGTVLRRRNAYPVESFGHCM